MNVTEMQHTCMFFVENNSHTFWLKKMPYLDLQNMDLNEKLTLFKSILFLAQNWK